MYRYNLHQISVVVLILFLLREIKWARCDPRRSTSVSISGAKSKPASVPQVVNPIFALEREHKPFFSYR